MTKQTNGEIFTFADNVPPAKEVKRSDPIEILLEWLVKRWSRPTISANEIYRHAPNSAGRNNKTMVLNLAQTLEDRGWLVRQPTWRHDRHEWKIARGLPLTQ
jgi:hypothetical protein